MRRTKSFAHTPTSVASARNFAGEALQGALGEARDTIALMISELASNCIRHTDAGFKLTIIQTAAEIRVEATDRGAGKPRMRTPAPTDPHGRGLQIVDMLATSWGFDALPGGGKTVWFALATQAPARVQA
jgi:anti-sigma regulatory factor (Ser/Thr protein kinase)